MKITDCNLKYLQVNLIALFICLHLALGSV
jgi:hypothetical protein